MTFPGVVFEADFRFQRVSVAQIRQWGRRQSCQAQQNQHWNVARLGFPVGVTKP